MKVIDYKKVDMTDAEYSYYKELVKNYTNEYDKGESYFRDLFETDEDGFITLVTPKKSIPLAILHFVQMLMINQRLRKIDEFLRKKELK